MNSIRYRILDKDGNKVFCNLKDKEILLIDAIDTSSIKLESDNVRVGKVSNQYGIIFASSTDKEYLKSSRKFKSYIDIIANSLEIITGIVRASKEAQNQSTNRLIHNLTTLNAHNIQEIYSLIPQDSVSRKMGEQISLVENIVKEEPRETALTLLRMAKNNAAMKTEFSVFKNLFESNPKLNMVNHNIHKVLMNVFYLFFPDFTDKGVKVTVSSSTETAYFDYESIHVSLYHLIENSAKYIKPNTILNVSIERVNEYVAIIFDMISTEIKESEKELIFEEGFSGDLSTRTAKAGSGIGLSRARKIIELNNGSINVIPQPRTAEVVMGITFQKNLFAVNLPRTRKRA